jgi:hypothetical protein
MLNTARTAPNYKVCNRVI